jgi:protein TonB
MRQLILAAVLASSAGVAEAQTWAQRPTTEEFQREYPPEALQAGIEGEVVLRCIIVEDGRLMACVTVSEEPTGWGFGQAAHRLSRLYRVDASVLSGLNGRRGVVEVVIHFPRRE